MEKMFIEYESKYNMDETIEILSETISNGGWKISIIHDLQDTLRKNSIHVLPLKVIELCNPKYSSQILGPDDLRIYSSLMPCRISVYEKENGKTYLSTMDANRMAEQIGGLVQKVMAEAYKDISGDISVVI
jgi:uncharacterized protein (DUF302 family)